MKSGTIFNIQKFSVNDGPGIRTTVFMKGCPLNCIWCHNPESKSTKQELFYNAEKCTGCRACENVCAYNCHSFDGNTHIFDRTNCVVCAKCAQVCYAGALELVGEEKTVSQVMEEVLKDKLFYENSGGGITLSGGEPMQQFEFTYKLLKAAKNEGLHTAIETCGFTQKENYEKIADLVDLFLFDYKETNPEKHKKFTGASNELILNNLFFLDSIGAKTILRCPIIPTLNDTKEHLTGIAETANKLKNVLEINVEPYHPLGQSKSAMLNKDYPLADLKFTDDKTVAEWIEYISSKTDIPVKKG